MQLEERAALGGVGIGSYAAVLIGAEVLSVRCFYGYDIPKRIIKHLSRKLLPHPVKDSMLVGAVARIPVHKAVISKRPDHRKPCAFFSYRQNAVIFKQRHLLAGRTKIYLPCLLVINNAFIYLVKSRFVKLPQANARIEGVCDALINIRPCYKPLRECVFSGSLYRAVLIGHSVAACLKAELVGLAMSESIFMRNDILREISPVTYHKPQAPLVL